MDPPIIDDIWSDSQSASDDTNYMPDSQDPFAILEDGDEWVDADTYLQNNTQDMIFPGRSRRSDSVLTYDTAQEPEEDLGRRDEDRRVAVDVCSEMIRPPGSDESLDQIVNSIRDKCQEIEVIESRLAVLEKKIEKLISEYMQNSGITERFPLLYVTRGMELSYMFEMYTRGSQDPTKYPPRYHMVNYVGETGIDGGGLRMEFFGEVLTQLRELFDYIDTDTDSPRMYISDAPDAELVERLNAVSARDVPYTTEDLSMLYMLAGAMCQHAVLGMYSTGIPLSRALLTAMVTPDTGVSELQLATIYLIEAYISGKDQVEMTKQAAESLNEEFMETLVERSKNVYLLDNPDKAKYVSDFINGFGISGLLSKHDISQGELYEIIGGMPFSKPDYEEWWRTNVYFSDPLVKERFLELHLGHDRELIQYMRDTKPGMRDMPDNEILEIYHRNTLISIASTPVISKRLRISVTTSNVNGMFAHSCTNTLEVNKHWILSTSFSYGDVPWVSQADLTFMSRGYTSQ